MLNLKKIILILAGNAYNYLHLPRPKITILGYHSISSNDTLVDIAKKTFRAQIGYLQTQGYRFISLDQAIQVAKGELRIENPSVVLTFDDGYHDLLDEVVPLLEKKHIPATYFVLSDTQYVNHAKIENHKKLMNRADIRKLSTYKHASIQCHTSSHIDLSKSSWSTAMTELAVSKTKLKKFTGQPIVSLAFPWGRYTSSTIRILKKLGYKAAVTTTPGFVTSETNVYELPRIMIDRTHTIDMFRVMLTPIYPYFFKLKKLTQYQRRFVFPLPLKPAYQLAIAIASYISSRDDFVKKLS